ncbi:MAG: sugar-binding domain-containing protein, partial [Bacteroidota bacterium]
MPSITTLKLASLIILGTIVCSCQPETTIEATTIDLSGQWLVKLDDSELQKNLQTIATELDGIDIKLPGTLDEAGLGNANTLEPALNNYILSHLARKNEYIGQAWYQRNFQLPSNWEGNRYILELERVLWESTLWVNGGKIGQQNSLIAPHRYNITEALQAGKNTITICIDNSDQLPGINVTSDRYPGATSGEMAHAYTNHTQIKWNGIIGKIQIHKVGSAQLENLQVYDNLAGNLLEFTCDGVDLSTLKYEVQHQGSLLQEGSLDVIKVGNLYRGQIGMEAPVLAWDEFSPNLYTLTLKTESGESISTNFGFSNISNQDGELHHNGRRIYLRGTLECAIFPLTGRPYTDKAEWKKMIQSAKAYGLNHLRFHSWCPPKAAFEAADEMGFYLQAELPHWNLEVGKDPVTNTFLRAEGDRILREYGNHPSFILMSMGNELQGDLGFLNQITSELKAKDSRRLYSTTTFSFQEGAGSIPQPEDEFYVTQWTDKGWVRGQGIFNDKAPHFDKDYTKEMEHLQLPLISHEIGQYSVFPDLSEIEKYTGVLEPLNFIAVQQDLAKKGLADQAADFTLASGKLATILYKEEIERALKTPGFDGFQLLQLQDFPGQGTALVGLLNAFWESKGAVDSATFKQFCGPVVPLLRFEKAVYPSGATFQADVQIANFWKEQKGLSLKWHVKNKDQVVTEGRLENIDLSLGNGNYPGFINPVLEFEEASQLTVGL